VVISVSKSRDYGEELDEIKTQMQGLQQLVSQIANDSPAKTVQFEKNEVGKVWIEKYTEEDRGGVFYSGKYRGEKSSFRWEPQERRVSQLLELDGDKAAKVLAALGQKQRLDILRSVLKEPLTGSELLERLNMGTTGQLYHHIKALVGADLLIQEERGGRYSIPAHRALPLLLLLAATSDLLDTSDYMALTETRDNAAAYLGNAKSEYDPHLLLWAIAENCILEHKAGYCSEVNIFLQGNGSITVADNGRGIPLETLPDTEKSRVQAVLTDIGHYSATASFVAPGAEKGINIAIANALSQKLSIEVRRGGRVCRQDFKHGIPQTGLLTIGTTKETGVSVTFVPDQEIFSTHFDQNLLTKRAVELAAIYPELTINVHKSTE
jgi:DNA gyrase subunit B